MPADLGTWIVEPLEPLVSGDGRPIGNTGVARARPLPPPTQVAGTVRAQAGSDAAGRFDVARRAEVKGYTVLGPFGVRLDAHGEVADYWFARPADALVLEPEKDGESTRLFRTLPLELPQGCGWSGELAGVGLPGRDPGKPDARAARFWGWEHGLLPWLKGRDVDLARAGLAGPASEVRTHVALDPRGVAADGMLYGVTGYRYAVRTVPSEGDELPWGGRRGVWHRYALALRTDAPLPEAIVRPLGGERRLASWRRVALPFPEVPEEVLASAADGAVRLYLATPAAFEAGLLPDPARLGAEVVGVAADRPLVVSGWDLELGKPKPTRRLVPAGSVYFLRLTTSSREERIAWARRTWGAAISDREQDRRDGLGVALLGTWDGSLASLDIGGGA